MTDLNTDEVVTTELGAAGTNALKAERAARKKAERQVRDLRAVLTRAVDDADALAERLAAALDRITR
jgi:hypothetical protein